jgi:formylglycine-generating enzyme required for sulfatase activity
MALIDRFELGFRPTDRTVDLLRAAGASEALVGHLRATSRALRASLSTASTPPALPEPECVRVARNPSGELWMARYEVTNSEYLAFCEHAAAKPPPSPYWGTPPRFPVVNVTWQEAQAYVRWLSLASRRRYRLPTEAEWEAGARGGARVLYPWGDASPVGRACFGVGRPCPVGAFTPNAFGLYDMAGGVAEWCQDAFEAGGKARVIRGGGWMVSRTGASLLAVERRERADPDKARADVGFRVVRER